MNEHCTQWPLKTCYEEALLPLMMLQIQRPVNIEVTGASVCMPNGRQWVLQGFVNAWQATCTDMCLCMFRRKHLSYILILGNAPLKRLLQGMTDPLDTAGA